MTTDRALRPTAGARATTAVVVVAGEVDVASSPHLVEVVAAALRPRTTAVVFDLARVTFIDSAGLEVLVDHRRRLTDAGLEVAFRSASPAVVRLLRWKWSVVAAEERSPRGTGQQACRCRSGHAWRS